MEGYIPVLRILNDFLIETYEKHYSRVNKPLITIYEAPTGYGKSSVFPFIAYKIRRSGVFYGYIHVLPMRSIIRSLYTDLLEGHKYPFNMIEDVKNNVGYQASGMTLSGKDPFYTKLYNITTIDSFMLNMLKLSIGEPNTYYKHYEASRSMIFTSMIILDEAHLYGGDPGAPEEKLYTSFTSLVGVLPYLNTPMSIISATIPISLGNAIYRRILAYTRSKNGVALWIKYGDKIRVNGKVIGEAVDREFDQRVESTRWKTEILSIRFNKLAKEINDKAETGRKILVITNKPVRAVNIYEHLASMDLDPVLVHGRLKYSERESMEKRIREANVVVATQVVEAGIDVSFDTIYTDPAPPTSLVQRIGRINRELRDDITGQVFIINDGEDSYKNIYDPEIVMNTLKLIKEYGDNINWRLPRGRDSSDIIGYYDLIEKIYQGLTPVIDTGLLHALKEIILSARIGWSQTRELMYKSCMKNTGIIRNSVLIPIIPVDITDQPSTNDITIEELFVEAVPVSLAWLIIRANTLLSRKSFILYIVFDDNGEPYPRFETAPRDPAELKKIIFGSLCGYRVHRNLSRCNGFFSGIVVEPRLYKPWKGLLVD